MFNRNASQGLLEIDDDQGILTYEDRHFGRHYVAKRRKRPTYLYSTPPESAKQSAHDHGKLVKFGDEPFPAILTLSCGETVGVHTVLPMDAPFLARELQGYPDVLEVVIFDQVVEKDDDMPETGDGIKITMKGYVLKSQVELQVKETFKPVSGDIFPNENLVDDIFQNTFGDCFLLASVLSILSQPGGDDFIRGMMRQDGDYTIVRLFHPETLEPCYIRVKNSDYHQQGRSVVKHQAPWVHILEKAYTAFGFKKQGNSTYVSYPAFREMFGNGGSPEFALKILTGQQANRIQIQEQASYPWNKNELMNCLPIYLSVMALINKLSNDELDGLDAYLSANANEAFLSALNKLIQQDDSEDLLAGVKKIEERFNVKPSISELIARIIKDSSESPDDVLRLFSSYIDKYLTLKVVHTTPLGEMMKSVRDFAAIGKSMLDLVQDDKHEEFFAAEKPIDNYMDVIEYFQHVDRFEDYFPAGLFDKFKEYAFTAQHWNSPFGLGRYSPATLAAYVEIEKRINEGRSIVATSKTTFSESNVLGLRNRHAYAIVGAYEKTLPSGAIVKMIQLRNPWGHTGREVDWRKKQRGEKSYIREVREKAEFEVELSDFTRYFRDYSVGPIVRPIPREVNDRVPSQRLRANTESQKNNQPGFFKRHWGKMLVGGLLIAGLVVAGIFTFGAVPAIAAGVAAGLALAHVTVSVTVAAGIGVGAIGLGAAAVGVGAGALMGVGSDKCCATDERVERSRVEEEDRRPLLLADDNDADSDRVLPRSRQDFDTRGIRKAIDGLPETKPRQNQHQVGEEQVSAVVGDRHVASSDVVHVNPTITTDPDLGSIKYLSSSH